MASNENSTIEQPVNMKNMYEPYSIENGRKISKRSVESSHIKAEDSVGQMVKRLK